MENTTRNNSENSKNEDGWFTKYPIYVFCTLTAVGVVLNVLSLIVLLLSPKRTKASRLYLIVLSITDSLVLIIQTGTVFGIFNKHEIACKSYYLRYVLRSFSAYIFAVISIQRLVMIRIPFKSSEYDKTKYGIVHLISAFIFAAASNAFAIPSLGVINGQCSIKPDYSDVHTYSYLILNYICSDVGVAILVLILTMLTVQGLVKSSKLGICKKGKGETSFTKMLIVLAVTFIILRLPETIGWLLIYLPYTLMKKPRDNTYNNMRIPHYIFNTLTLVNFAINFIVYVIFWPAFRERFCRTFRAAPVKREAMSTTLQTIS